MHLWISKNGVTQGPYAETQLKSMWQNGAITADSLCWKEGFACWVPVESFINAAHVQTHLKEDSTPQTTTKPSAQPVKKKPSALPYTPSELLQLVSYREKMGLLYITASVLTLLGGFAELNAKGTSPAPALLVISLLAVVCWVFTCYFVFVLMRVMKSGALGASLCLIVVAFIPLASIVTAISIYVMAKNELKNAGVKIGSASFMKNQILRMKR